MIPMTAFHTYAVCVCIVTVLLLLLLILIYKHHSFVAHVNWKVKLAYT